MAVETSVSRMHTGRSIALAIMCLVFGLWGLYDYMISIPNQAWQAQIKNVVSIVQQSLTSTDQDLNQEALAAIDEMLKELQARLNNAANSLSQNNSSPEELQQRLVEEENRDIQLVIILSQSKVVLENREANPELTRLVNERINSEMRGLEEVTAPGKFDSAIQWLFIICLPFTVYFLWQWLSIRTNKYVLEDDGSLQTPEGHFSAEEVVDIDMSRWMAKSVATVVLANEQLIKLDAYIHTNLDKIVGILAHKFHPDKWKEDAKPVKPILENNDGDAPTSDSDDSADGE